MDEARLELGNVPQAERLEVAKVADNRFDGGVHDTRVFGRHVPAHDGRP